MKLLGLLCCLIGLALAVPIDDAQHAQILRYDNDNIGVEGYNFAFETSDGTSRQEQAQLKNIGTENEALSVRGSFSYLGDDGVTYTVNYVADESGFQPEAAHLPRA